MDLHPTLARNDAHTHVWHAPRFPERVPSGVEGSVSALLADLDSANVQRAAVITPRSMGWDDEVTLAAARRNPDRLVAIMRYDLDDPAAPAALMAKVARGARGVRIASDDGDLARFLEPAADPFWAALESAGLPLAVNAAPEQLASVEGMLQRHPSTTMLFDHAGRPAVSNGLDHPHFRSVLALARYPQLVLKTPDAPYFSNEGYPFADLSPFLSAAIDAFGPERLAWASDWPLCTQEYPYRASVEPTATMVASLSENDAALVMGGNFDRVYGRG